MFRKEDNNIPDNNIQGVIKEDTEEFDTSLDHGLFKIKCESDEEATTFNTLDYQSSNIKCEFEEDETKIQYGVLENQLKEENFDESQFFIANSEFSENTQKIASTINDMFYKKAINIGDDEIESKLTEIYDELNTSLDSSNIKSEFEEEETKIQYGVFENQLHEENFDKSTTDIPKLRMLDGECTKMFQKTEVPISTMFSKEDIGSPRSQKTDSIIFSNRKSHICEFCNQCFNTTGTLNVHQTICRVGHYKCKIFAKIIDHHNTQTNENVHKCETCNKFFTRKGHLNIHMKIHTGEKPYKCETCGKCFSRKPLLNLHDRTHKGEKPYKCVTCGKCFTLKTNLDCHNRTHTGEKPYKCETCGKCFTTKGNLNKHNSMHTGEKPYKCETCGKCFIVKGNLNRHNRTHNGEKPYKCDTCGKCFAEKKNLDGHSRTHTGEKPYKCETCGKCFSEKRYLNKHNRTHINEEEAL